MVATLAWTQFVLRGKNDQILRAKEDKLSD